MDFFLTNKLWEIIFLAYITFCVTLVGYFMFKFTDKKCPQCFKQQTRLLFESNGKCKAYSDQGTLLDIPQNFCKKWLRDGRYNPYKTPPQQQQIQPNNSEQTTTQSSPHIASLTDSTTKDTMRPSVHLDAQ